MHVFYKVISTWSQMGPEFVKGVSNVTILVSTVVNDGVKISPTCLDPLPQDVGVSLISHQSVNAVELMVLF
jgi:hypothetical protein